MPTHFRWVWYLVGLAGMVLTIVGVLAILGSAADLGILLPVVFVGAVAIGYVIVRFRRSLNAAVAAAPSRQAGAGSTAATDEGAPAESGPPGNGTAGADDTAGAGSTSTPGPAAKKPPGGPPRTSRR